MDAAGLGNRIHEVRKRAEISSDKLAERSGCSANFIQEVERGRSGLSSESIRAFSPAFKVSADTLLFGEAPEEFTYMIRRLKTVPPQKLDHIIRIIEEAIECACN